MFLRRRAFSLIELLAVLAIMGILTGLTAFSLAGVGRAEGFRETIQRFKFSEKLIRLQAKTGATVVQMAVDLNKGQITTVDAQNGRGLGKPYLLLGSETKLGGLIVNGKRVMDGQVSIPYSSTGYSPSYALLIQGPAGAKQWLFVAGLTGQVTELSNESEALSLLPPTPSLTGEH